MYPEASFESIAENCTDRPNSRVFSKCTAGGGNAFRLKFAQGRVWGRAEDGPGGPRAGPGPEICQSATGRAGPKSGRAGPGRARPGRAEFFNIAKMK